jgi:hypothetical protein
MSLSQPNHISNGFSGPRSYLNSSESESTYSVDRLPIHHETTNLDEEFIKLLNKVKIKSESEISSNNKPTYTDKVPQCSSIDVFKSNIQIIPTSEIRVKYMPEYEFRKISIDYLVKKKRKNDEANLHVYYKGRKEEETKNSNIVKLKQPRPLRTQASMKIVKNIRF